MPIDRGFKEEMLNRKREEYAEIVRNYFGDFSTEIYSSNENKHF